jgi:hypothetical protein
MERALYTQQKDPKRSMPAVDSLYAPAKDGNAAGPYDGHVMRSSLYTRAVMSDVARAMPLVAAAAVFAAGVRRWRASGA